MDQATCLPPRLALEGLFQAAGRGKYFCSNGTNACSRLYPGREASLRHNKVLERFVSLCCILSNDPQWAGRQGHMCLSVRRCATLLPVSTSPDAPPLLFLLDHQDEKLSLPMPQTMMGHLVETEWAVAGHKGDERTFFSDSHEGQQPQTGHMAHVKGNRFVPCNSADFRYSGSSHINNQGSKSSPISSASCDIIQPDTW